MTPAIWMAAWIGFLGLGLAVAALVEARRGDAGRWLAIWIGVGAAALAVMAMAMTKMTGPQAVALPFPWPALVLAPLPLAPLWAFIAAVLFAAAVGSSLAHPRRRQVFYALLPLEAGIGIYLWSGDGLLLLMSWEFVSAVTYLGLVGPRRSRSVWTAGWALLGLSELGGMLLLATLTWLTVSGLHPVDSLPVLGARAQAAGPGIATVLMGLALLAFGVKAGLFPVMIWMPMAEPEAPGVVAGLFSGLLPGLAVIGLLALDGWFRPGLGWAWLLLLLGVLGSLTGALYALVSRHVKRVLAYSTLEVMGLVFGALGVWHWESLVAVRNVAATLALDAALFLLISHAGAKFALFAVTDFTGRFSHTLDHLGGLARRAPRTAFWVLLAIAVLAGVPPLGGFVGEWLLLEAVLKPLGAGAVAVHLFLMAAGGFLAMAVALGVTSYLRWFGFVFLGPFRERPTWPLPAEAPGCLRAGIAGPAILGAAVGPTLPWLLPWVNRRLTGWLQTPAAVLAPTRTDPSRVAALVKIGGNLLPTPGTAGSIVFPQGFAVADPTVLLLMGLVLAAAVAALRAAARRRRPVRFTPPWTGGWTPYSSRTSFSAEGFVHPLRLAFAGFYGLRRQRTDAPGVRFYRHTIVYRVEAHLYRPLLQGARWAAGHVRRLQSGSLSQYLAYLGLAALAVWLMGLGH